MSKLNILCHGLKGEEKALLEKEFAKTIDIYMENKGITNSNIGSEEWKRDLRDSGVCEDDIELTLKTIYELRSKNNQSNKIDI